MFSINPLSHDIQCSDYLLNQQQQQSHEPEHEHEHEITEYNFQQQPHEKPPLTAIGEVIELIGNEWNSNGESWKNTGHNILQSGCHFCGQPIQERFLLKVGNIFCHEHCLHCCICNENLTEKCYEKNGYFYCSFHYYSNFSPYQCSGCHLGISPNEMVYKLKDGLIYHIHCHFCYQCGKNLSPGEHIVVDGTTNSISCLSHNSETSSEDQDQLQQQQQQQQPTSESKPAKVKSPTTLKKKKEKHSKKEKRLFKKESSEFGLSSSSMLPTSSTIFLNPIIPQYPFEMYAFGELYSDDGRLMKRRGPRTTIKQNQLDVLNQIFSSTPKPSKHARAKLALETGLSMRVIQVWFQNRRSKERRLKHLCNFLRHYEQQGLPPPPFNINPEDGSVIPASGAFSPSCFSLDDSSFIYDDETAELSS